MYTICRNDSALTTAILQKAPAKMISALIENYPKEINARGSAEGRYFSITSSIYLFFYLSI